MRSLLEIARTLFTGIDYLADSRGQRLPAVGGDEYQRQFQRLECQYDRDQC